jgi:hypothetical protein
MAASSSVCTPSKKEKSSISFCRTMYSGSSGLVVTEEGAGAGGEGGGVWVAAANSPSFVSPTRGVEWCSRSSGVDGSALVGAGASAAPLELASPSCAETPVTVEAFGGEAGGEGVGEGVRTAAGGGDAGNPSNAAFATVSSASALVTLSFSVRTKSHSCEVSSAYTCDWHFTCATSALVQELGIPSYSVKKRCTCTYACAG